MKAKESKILSTPIPHDRLVEMTAERLASHGCAHVRASHPNRFRACDQIGDYIPDVTAFSGSTLVVVEAESSDGLGETHTEEQWRTFHNHASRVGDYFIAVVNKADEATARALLTRVCGNAANARLWTF